MIISNDWFCDLNSIEIVSLLSLFTDVNVSKEERIYEPSCNNENIQKYACLLKTYYENYDDLEYAKNVYSGYDYVDTLMYDMPNLVEAWCSYNSEKECKFFLQNDVALKGISVGDFTKALLKISTIIREIGVIAEKMGQIECLHKLSECDGFILKYITTAQSLYV